MLKNKVKILIMSLLLHIELQNFLNAPRILEALSATQLTVFMSLAIKTKSWKVISLPSSSYLAHTVDSYCMDTGIKA